MATLISADSGPLVAVVEVAAVAVVETAVAAETAVAVPVAVEMVAVAPVERAEPADNLPVGDLLRPTPTRDLPRLLLRPRPRPMAVRLTRLSLTSPPGSKTELRYSRGLHSFSRTARSRTARIIPTRTVCRSD